MKRGELVFTKTLKAEFSNATSRGTVGFKVPPGQLMMLICMGTCLAEDMNKVEADKLLVSMGWTPPTPKEPHPDDLAVDRFAAAMKARMAQKRAEGMDGWDDPERITVGCLQRSLAVTPLSRPVDIGNYAMMLFNRALTKDPA